MITVFQIWYKSNPIPEMLKSWMEDWKRWANEQGYRYILHEPDYHHGELTERYASDLERIKIAAACAPCLYIDADIQRLPGFCINHAMQSQFGCPPIAFFYLPNNWIANDVLVDYEKMLSQKKDLGRHTIVDLFEKKVYFDKTTYCHYQWHRKSQQVKE